MNNYITYVTILAFLVGITQVFFGIFRLGVIFNFLSHSVVVGFINAAAIII
jgi:SulP family sulfate permease